MNNNQFLLIIESLNKGLITSEQANKLFDKVIK
jgi:hypothetical protein